MAIRRTAGVCVLCAWVLGPLQVRAQATADGGARAAEAYAAEALENHRAGRYLEAAQLFLLAHALSRNPTQLRNAAKAYAQAGSFDEALSRWNAYAQLPGLTERQRAEARTSIAELAMDVERRRATERGDARDRPPAVDVAPAPPAAEPKSEVARWLVAAGGGLALAAGVGLYASSWVTYGRIDETEALLPITYADAEAARLRAGAGIGLSALGAVLVAGSLWWPRSDATLVLHPTARGAWAGLASRF